MYKNLLLDFHGVIAHLDRARAIERVNHHSGNLLLSPNEILEKFFYINPYYREIDLGLLTYSQMLRYIMPSVWRGTYAGWLKLWAVIWDCYSPCLMVMDLIRECTEQQVGVLVVTDNHNEFREWLSRHSVFAPLAKTLLCSAEVGITKPNREFYQLAASRLNTVFSSCVYLDDSKLNVTQASLYGITSFHYSSPDQQGVIRSVKEALYGDI